MDSSEQVATAKPRQRKATVTTAASRTNPNAVAASRANTNVKVGKNASKKHQKVRTDGERLKHRAGSKMAHARQDDDLERLTDDMNAKLAANKIEKSRRGKRYTRLVLRKMLHMINASKEGKAFIAQLKEARPEDKDKNQAEEDEDEELTELDGSQVLETIVEGDEDADSAAPVDARDARIGALEAEVERLSAGLETQELANAVSQAEMKKLKDVLRGSGIVMDAE